MRSKNRSNRAQKSDQNQSSALVPRLRPRFAVSQKTATKRHSPCGVNRGVAAIEHNAPLRKIAPFANTVRSVGQSRVTRRYVLRPSTSAKPICAPEGAGIGQGNSPRSCLAWGRAAPAVRSKATQNPTSQPASGAREKPALHRISQRVVSIAVKAKPCGRCAAWTGRAWGICYDVMHVPNPFANRVELEKW